MTQPPFQFDLSGGRLCLDLANTVGGMRGVTPKDHLAGYPDLLEFARQAGAIDEGRARRLAGEAHRHPERAARAFARALELREALYRIFLARAERRPLPAADLERLSAALGDALSHRTLERRGDGFALGWQEPSADALDAPLWPVIASAAEVLTSGAEADRVRVCGLFETHECSWLFVDETRAGTRRWCSMQDCGNKAKARRHQERARAQRT